MFHLKRVALLTKPCVSLCYRAHHESGTEQRWASDKIDWRAYRPLSLKCPTLKHTQQITVRWAYSAFKAWAALLASSHVQQSYLSPNKTPEDAWVGMGWFWTAEVNTALWSYCLMPPAERRAGHEEKKVSVCLWGPINLSRMSVFTTARLCLLWTGRGPGESSGSSDPAAESLGWGEQAWAVQNKKTSSSLGWTIEAHTQTHSLALLCRGMSITGGKCKQTVSA